VVTDTESVPDGNERPRGDAERTRPRIGSTGRGLRSELRTFLARFPRLFIPLARRWAPGDWITGDTEFVIEGYPRSGNTFATAAFGLAKTGPHPKVSHHTHAPASVILAARRGIPALVLIRRPEDAVVSVVVRQPDLPMQAALRAYVGFYRPLLRYRDRIVVATFDEVVRDFGAVIRRVNERFSTTFGVFHHTEENARQALALIEQEERVRRGAGPELIRTAAFPMESRSRLKDERRAEYGSPRLRTLRARAESLYEGFTGEIATRAPERREAPGAGNASRGRRWADAAAVRRLRSEVRIFLARFPRLFVPLARRWGTGDWITAETEFVIEGYPRSGNTFATAAFGLAKTSPHPIVGHHTHSPAQVVTAARRGIPTLVLIRYPEEAVLSLVIQQPYRSVRSALREWIAFYEPLPRYRDRIEVATFEEVVGDFGAVTKRVNRRFGTHFDVFEHNSENARRALELIEQDARRLWRGGRDLQLKGAFPSAERANAKELLRPQYRSRRLLALRRKAEGLYRLLTEELTP
jgi:hypothetical protein